MTTKKSVKKKPALIKSTAATQHIAITIDKLAVTSTEVKKSLASHTVLSKKLAKESQRLGKKRSTLVKRKKAAFKRLKQSPSTETRKAAKSVEKELATVVKQWAKVKTDKVALSEEITALRVNDKTLAAYLKVIDNANTVPSKPTKKPKKKAKNPAVLSVTQVEVLSQKVA